MTTANSPLKRSLSLPVVTLYGLGTIIGAGIYVLIGEVVATSGYLTPAAFLMASIIAAFSAFSYAELSSRYPLSAGQAVYVQQAFGIRAYSTTIGLLMVFVGIIASATLVRGFIGYFHYLIAVDETLSIVLLVLSLGAVAAWGITQSSWIAIVTTLIEIGGLLRIIWVARDGLAEMPMLLSHASSQFSEGGWGPITAGAFIAFFAFLGFEDIVNVAEEVKNPTHNLPLAIILSLVISTLLDIAISVVAIATVPPAELAGNPAPLALVYERAVGESPTFIIMVSIAAIINGTLIMMIMSSRILYGMSRQQWLPSRLSRVNPTTKTPLFATAVISLLILIFALWLPLTNLAITTSLFTLIVFFSINLSLLVIKLRDRQFDRHPDDIRCFPIW
ncbi:MAG: amino acid permease, partial [Gammaproteobacteria bacterium]|nr:amino acid permease [Gammaproteobacteria bacterium]